MAGSQHKEKQASKRTSDETTAEAKDLRDPELSTVTDELLDEIDGVLEENAEEFVRNYIQKGGQ